MTEVAPPFEVFRCPSCGRPGKEAFERCRHCGVNYKTGQVDGFAARTFSGGGTSLPFLVGAFLLGFSSLAVIATIAINTRSPSPTPTSVQAAAATETALPAPPLPTATYTAAQRAVICRAAIAKMMGHDLGIMNGKPRPGGLVRVQYRRPDDNKLWQSDCRLIGNQIIWRGVNSFNNRRIERWRDRPEDGTLKFSRLGKTLIITEVYSDGSSDAVAFNI